MFLAHNEVSDDILHVTYPIFVHNPYFVPKEICIGHLLKSSDKTKSKFAKAEFGWNLSVIIFTQFVGFHFPMCFVRW